jgi:hypothetical protein
MYSLVVLGWPATTMRPRRSMSTPTEIMLLASRTSTRSLLGVGLLEAALGGAILAVALAAGQLDGLAQVAVCGPSGGCAFFVVVAGAPGLGGRAAGAYVVFDEAAHAAELAQRVEVAGEGHVAVGGLGSGPWGRRRSRRRRAGRRRCAGGSPSSRGRGGDADVAAPGGREVDGGEPCLEGVDAGRREQVGVRRGRTGPGSACWPGGRSRWRRGSWGGRAAVRAVAGAELLDRGLVEADHGAERAGDQVELVLHDQLGRAQAVRERGGAARGAPPRGPWKRRPSRRWRGRTAGPVSPRQGSMANLSTVAMRKAGSSR